MIDSKDILTLLSIPCEEVSNVEIISDTSEITFIDIELKDNRPFCPFCFQNNGRKVRDCTWLFLRYR